MRLFPGDEATLSVNVRNGKRLPVSLELFQPFPEGLDEITPAREGGFPGSPRRVLLGQSCEALSNFPRQGPFQGLLRHSPGQDRLKGPSGALFKGNHSRLPGGPCLPRVADLRTRLRPAHLMGDTRSDRPAMTLQGYPACGTTHRIRRHEGSTGRRAPGTVTPGQGVGTYGRPKVVHSPGWGCFQLPGPSMEKALSVAATLAVWADEKKCLRPRVQPVPPRSVRPGLPPGGLWPFPAQLGPRSAGKGGISYGVTLQGTFVRGIKALALGYDDHCHTLRWLR